MQRGLGAGGAVGDQLGRGNERDQPLGELRAEPHAAPEPPTAGLLSIPGGPVVLALVGLGIGIGGIVFIIMIVRGSARR